LLLAKTHQLPPVLPLVESLLRISAEVLLITDDQDRTPLRIALELLLSVHRTCQESTCLKRIELLTRTKTPALFGNIEQKKLMQITDWGGASPLDFYKTRFMIDSTWPYAYDLPSVESLLKSLSI